MRKHYKLRCLGDNTLFDDYWYPPNSNISSNSGNLLKNPKFDGDALLVSEYKDPLTINEQYKSILKYSWLPVLEPFEYTAAPVTFKSEKIAKHIGLSQLYCTFSGYAPSINAYNPTCSFKEYEAIGVLGRHGLKNDSVLVLSSAGNTARAFANLITHLVQQEGESAITTKVVLVVPKNNLSQIWIPNTPIQKNLLLCSVEGDYSDAINIAHQIAAHEGYTIEGGVRNIGRRDGMGCTFLSAVEYLQRIPDHYFQAVGSASGAISAWEASSRHKKLMNTPGPSYPVLHISQNSPFTPIIDSWEAQSPTLLPIDKEIAAKQIAQLSAPVLSNRMPPYSVIGGVYDAMSQTKGRGYRVSNEEAAQAQKLFFEHEQLAIGNSSAVACASLLQAVKNKSINPDEVIMLNLTDGGEAELARNHTLTNLEAQIAISPSPDINALLQQIQSLLK